MIFDLEILAYFPKTRCKLTQEDFSWYQLITITMPSHVCALGLLSFSDFASTSKYLATGQLTCCFGKSAAVKGPTIRFIKQRSSFVSPLPLILISRKPNAVVLFSVTPKEKPILRFHRLRLYLIPSKQTDSM